MFRFFVRAPPNISFTCRFAAQGLPVVSRGAIIPVQGYQIVSNRRCASNQANDSLQQQMKAFFELDQKQSEQINNLVESNKQIEEAIARNKEAVARNKEAVASNKKENARDKDRIDELEKKADYVESVLIVVKMISRIKKRFGDEWMKEKGDFPAFNVFDKDDVANQTEEDKELIDSIMGMHFRTNMNKFSPIIQHLVDVRNNLTHSYVALRADLSTAVEFLSKHEDFQGEDKNPLGLAAFFSECSGKISGFKNKKNNSSNSSRHQPSIRNRGNPPSYDFQQNIRNNGIAITRRNLPHFTHRQSDGNNTSNGFRAPSSRPPSSLSQQNLYFYHPSPSQQTYHQTGAKK